MGPQSTNGEPLSRSLDPLSIPTVSESTPGAAVKAAASAWANAVPKGAVCLIAVLDSTADGKHSRVALATLAACGLGSPTALPIGCNAGVAVGIRSETQWNATHASADAAVASIAIASTESSTPRL